MIEPSVTIVMTPWQQFGGTEAALENVYACTQLPFALVYFDNNSPASTKEYLEHQAQRRHFTLIRSKCYVCSNEARNVALQHVHTKYVVFIDNGVRVAPGWLEALVDCAEETGAWVVGPIYCTGDPSNPIIYVAKPELRITVENGRRHLEEVPTHLHERLADVRRDLRRAACTFAKFHCMLVRMDVFDRLGPFDEAYLSFDDHRAFCLAIQEASGSIYFEPGALVTLVSPPLAWSDIPFFLLRWSDAWLRPSMRHFSERWRVDLQDDGMQGLVRFRNMSRRRLFTLLVRVASSLGWRARGVAEKLRELIFDQLIEKTVIRQLEGRRVKTYRIYCIFTASQAEAVAAQDLLSQSEVSANA